jgi:hypothetical protein
LEEFGVLDLSSLRQIQPSEFSVIGLSVPIQEVLVAYMTDPLLEPESARFVTVAAVSHPSVTCGTDGKVMTGSQ